MPYALSSSRSARIAHACTFCRDVCPRAAGADNVRTATPLRAAPQNRGVLPDVY